MQEAGGRTGMGRRLQKGLQSCAGGAEGGCKDMHGQGMQERGAELCRGVQEVGDELCRRGCKDMHGQGMQKRGAGLCRGCRKEVLSHTWLGGAGGGC